MDRESNYIKNLREAKNRTADWPAWKKETLQSSSAVFDFSEAEKRFFAAMFKK